MVKLFVKKAADFKIPTNKGQTILYNISMNGNPKIVRLLLSYGAKINRVNRYKLTLLLSVASENKFNAVELLLKAEANPNYSANDGMILLIKTSNNGHLYIVRLLINHGAEITTSSTNN